MQHIPSEEPQEQVAFTPHMNDASGSQPALDHIVSPAQSEQSSSFFYTQDEGDFPFQRPLVDEPEGHADQSSPFVLPFQHSGAMPTIVQTNTQGASASVGTPPSPSPAGTSRKRSRHLLKIVLIASILLVTVLGTTLLVFAQVAPSPSTPQGTRAKATTTPAHQNPGNQNQGGGTQGTSAPPSSNLPSAQLLDHIGWTQAGLSFADALEATRTATTFTDREMSYDYRNIGTLTKHGGTLTASTFLLTPGGLARFVRNDIRVVNNRLYEKIRAGKMIQQVVNAQSSLVQRQTVQFQGKQEQCVWVNVAFELFQSNIDPANGKRTENLELAPATGQPVIHHMMVVLLRVPPQDQEANAPMGGTGWLVNTYTLDTTALPAIATTPTL